MKFGQVADPADVDFTIPDDHPGTGELADEKQGKGLEYLCWLRRNGTRRT